MVSKYILKQKNRVGQRKLRAKKKSSQYKSVDKYLNQVYENNSGYLDTHFDVFDRNVTKAERRKKWKNQVKEIMNEINPLTGKKYSVNQAIDYVSRTEDVRTSGERGFERIMTEIRDTDKELFKQMRKDLGWKEKIRSENSRYVGFEDNYYIYEYRKANGSKVYIKIEISPSAGAAINIQVLPENQFLSKLKLPKYLQDQYSNVKNEEQRKVAEAASSAVEDILKKYGGK